MKQTPEDIAREDGRYSPEAFRFVYEGLGYTVKHLTDEPGHVTGQLLCEGLRKLALKRWGRMALPVLNSWGLHKTSDFGEIVYTLIEHGWMSARPTDSIHDFDDVYSFPTAFVDGFEF